jgi:flagellar hook-associated protein 2
MAIASTSSSTSTGTSTTSSTTSVGGVGQGSVIDVAGLVAKMGAIDQVPIDKLNAQVTAEDQAITDLGTIKTKMAAFQAALQDFTDPISYLNNTVTSGNTALVGASISNSANANPGVYNVNVTQIAKTSTATYSFNFASAGSISLKASDGTLQTFALVAANATGINSLTALRDAINTSSSASKVRADIVNTGSTLALTLTSTTGGAVSNVQLTDTSNLGVLIGTPQAGQDAAFTVNGQSFTRTSNIVDDALPGVQLQLQSAGSASISINAGSSDTAKTLLTNLGQAYNDLVTSYTSFTKFDSDPTKRGSLYGYMDLRTMVDSISLSFMSPLTNSAGVLKDTGNNPISFTTLGLELQLDGSLLFDPTIFQSAVNQGAISKISNGSISPTRTLVTDAMTYGGKVDSFISTYTEQKLTLQNRIQDLQTRKTQQMAKYQAQYAALDALLYRLQALNSSLTPTFTALNNPKNN